MFTHLIQITYTSSQLDSDSNCFLLQYFHQRLWEASHWLSKAVPLNLFAMPHSSFLVLIALHAVRGTCVTVLIVSPRITPRAPPRVLPVLIASFRACCSSAVLCSPSSCCTEPSSSDTLYWGYTLYRARILSLISLVFVGDKLENKYMFH